MSYLPADGKQDLVDELQSKCFPFILENLDKVNLTMAKAFNPLMTVDLGLKLPFNQLLEVSVGGGVPEIIISA